MDQPTTNTQEELDAFLGVQPPSRRGAMLKWAAIAIGVVLLALLAWRLFFAGDAAVGYATQRVERGNLTVTVAATGNLQPTNQVDVGSELSGLITDVYVDNNDRVTKGQVLARLDTRAFVDAVNQRRAGLDSARAQVAQAQATVTQTRANLTRLEEVYRISGGKVPSRAELDTGRADYARAVAAVRTAQAAVAQAQALLSSDQTQLSRASIVSPVNGVVLSRQIEPGQTVAASLNAPVLFQIAEDLSQMQLEVKVDEADVGQVKDGQRATFAVDAFPGRTFPARIERVDVGANASGSTSSTSTSTSTTSASGSVVAYTAILSVANPEELLLPGMTATADIVTTEKRNVLLVPNAALRFTPDSAAAGSGGGGIAGAIAPMRPRRGNRATREVAIGRGSRQTVYVKDAEGKPKPIQVTVGDTNGSQTEVSGAGLEPGMEVITGQLASEDGASSSGGARGGQRRQGGGGGGQGGQRGQ
ncbi:efflux RND transporter periplasmic adaptor subunit [Sphingomonas sp. 1P06PA]|uniref:efflux RND transporter periplasmic adaptor subunit n=1 Tax=Sphingomonas sp. 1P06PA TaxID=554121 RepID=UPI0039A786F4